MLAHALEMRELADRHGVRSTPTCSAARWPSPAATSATTWSRTCWGDDVVVAHGNGFEPDEVALLGERRVHVATVAHTHEDLWYGVAPIVDLLEAGANVAIATDGAAPYASTTSCASPRARSGTSGCSTLAARAAAREGAADDHDRRGPRARPRRRGRLARGRQAPRTSSRSTSARRT
jgi:hypothetical protein